MINTDGFYFMKDGILIKTLPKHIVFIKSDDNYCRFYLRDGQSHVMRITLKAVEEKLQGDSFTRCHRQYIINLEFVDAVDMVNKKILTAQDHQIPYSRSRKKQLFEAMKNR